MATMPKNTVVQAFLDDHKEFMRLLNQTATAMENRDMDSARSLAIQLNDVAGPHIAFEESVLYPLLDEVTHERGFVKGLYGEHQSIVTAISELIATDELSDDRMESIREAIRLGVDHADHCGTLVSNLSALNECDQQEALDELLQLRSQNIKWTDLKKES